MKPCPFCGSTDLRISSVVTGHGQSDPAVKCKCGCQLEGIWLTEAQLVDKWNTRNRCDQTNTLISREAVIAVLEQAKPWGNSADDYAAHCLQEAIDKINKLKIQ